MKKKLIALFFFFMLIIVLSGCGNYIRIGKRKIVGDLKLVQVNHKWRVEGAVDKNIKEIVIPSGYGIKGFYNKAFANYTSLEKVDIQEDIKIIEDQTFAGCVNLKEVILPDSITTIFAGAFSGCESLHITKLPEKLTTIGGCAFKDVHLDSLVFPVGVGIIRDSQLYGAIINNLYFLNDNIVMERNCFESAIIEELELPKNIDRISDRAFYKAHIINLIIPESVKKIGQYAFANATIEDITLPIGLEIIEMHAFSECKGLEEIIIPNSVKQIEHNAFYKCNSIKKMKLSNSLLEGSNNLPPKLVEITIDETENSFKVDGLFLLDAKKEKILYFLYNSEKIIRIPETIVEIGDYAFEYREYFKELFIPSSVKKIGYSAFKDCDDLEKVTFEGTNIEFGNSAFAGNDKLNNIIIPLGVKKISASMFDGCSSLENIILPDSIEEIGSLAFYGTLVNKINIPNNVKILGSWIIFDSMGRTKYVILPKSVNEIYGDPFLNMNVYYYQGTKDEWYSNVTHYISENETYIIDKNNILSEKSKIYFYSETRPESDVGSYWYYDGHGNPSVWQ